VSNNSVKLSLCGDGTVVSVSRWAAEAPGCSLSPIDPFDGEDQKPRFDAGPH